MAVPAYLRQESKAKYVTVATRLAAWTLKWCKDERLFSRRERWIVTGDVWTAAKGCLMCTKKANERKDLGNPQLYIEREAFLREALDHLTDLKVLLTIKYEMISQGFDAPKQPEAKPQAEAREGGNAAQQPAKQKRGGRKTLTQDDIDRIFEFFFQLAIFDEELIRGIMESDAKWHAKASRPI